MTHSFWTWNRPARPLDLVAFLILCLVSFAIIDPIIVAMGLPFRYVWPINLTAIALGLIHALGVLARQRWGGRS